MKVREMTLVASLVLAGAATRGAMAESQRSVTPPADSVPTAEQAPPGDAPAGASVLGPAPVLARLHQAAAREIQLAELAESGGGGRATRAYGAELAADFKRFDDKVVAFAAVRGIGEEALNAPLPGENLVAMRHQVTDLGRLADARGLQFDREFWVAVAGEQSAASDMLPKTMVDEPSLSALVTEFSQTLDGASARALVASRPTTAAPPTQAVNPQAEGAPCAGECR
jgi:hypothetical protein